MLNSKYRGVFPALVAPQDEQNNVLFDVMGELAIRQLKDGAAGFLINGHTGELALLAGDERRQALKTVRDAVGPEVPLIAGVHPQGLRSFPSQAESAAECGADAVLLFAPFSFARGAFQYAPEAVIDYCREAAASSPLPLWFMQYRPQTNLMMPREVLRQVAGLPNIGGVKQEVEDNIEYERDLITLREVNPDLPVFTATERGLLGNYVHGADGCTIGLANFVRPVKAIQDAVWAEDLAGARTAARALLPLADAIYRPPSFRWSARLKYAIHAAGWIPTPNIRSPLFPASDEERRIIDGIIDEYRN
jgi:4-hydroxy-tetrahydrodipicolinate synthase